MKRVGIYAGSFDPLTLGHVWMIEQGCRLFDELIVAVGDNPGKKPLFAATERLAMLSEVTAGMSGVRVANFSLQYLIRYAGDVGADYILRGIRSGTDYEYERVMRHVNDDIDAAITTVFLMPPREIAEVSSSMVKGLIGPPGWEDLVARYVPPAVLSRLRQQAHG